MLLQQQLQDHAGDLRYLDAAAAARCRGSVLWLLGRLTRRDERTPARGRSARHRAGATDICARRCRSPEHLARQRRADLFLDTLPYNAHTTASDALWAGLPVLTCAGDTFAGRVAGSLLRAVGLDELVTTSLKEYEALALLLAQDTKLLARLRARLAENRWTFPLFNTERSTRNLEDGISADVDNLGGGTAARRALRRPDTFAVHGAFGLEHGIAERTLGRPGGRPGSCGPCALASRTIRPAD